MLSNTLMVEPLINKSTMSSTQHLAYASVSFEKWQDGGSEQSMIREGLTEMKDLCTVDVFLKTRTDMQ